MTPERRRSHGTAVATHLKPWGLATVLLMALLASGPMPAQPIKGGLPALGDGGEMTLGAERKLGERIARELYRDPDYVDDEVLSDYVQSLWRPLLAAARARGELSPELEQRFAWEILLGRDRSVNAFALPGGYLGLHLGLLGVAASRDELASVLAHELSHVTQRHISRLLTQQERMTPWMLGAMILGIVAASKNPQAGQAVIVGGQAVAAQAQLNFSRDMEREADRIGHGVLTQAGFSGQGFVGLFERLQQASRLNDSGAFPYLRSHPLTTERMADMRSRQPLDAPEASPAAPDLEHAMMGARARVLTQPGVDVLRAWVTEGAQLDGIDGARPVTAQRVATLYAAAIASAQLRDWPRANALAARLIPLVTDDARAARQAHVLAADIAFQSGDLPGAAQALASAPARAPARIPTIAAAVEHADKPLAGGLERPELFLLSRLRIRTGQAAQAAAELQIWVLEHPRDAAAWQLLADARNAQGQSLRAIHAEGEAHAARFDYGAAEDRLRAAQNLFRTSSEQAGKHIEASIIDTRLRELELLRREQALER